MRGIHAQVTVNSWQSRVPCVAVRGRRSGAEPRARESAHTGTTANSWLYRAEGRGKEREKREGGREGERERGSEGERERGREGERKRGREEERKRGRKEGREEKGERERERGIRTKRGIQGRGREDRFKCSAKCRKLEF